LLEHDLFEKPVPTFPDHTRFAPRFTLNTGKKQEKIVRLRLIKGTDMGRTGKKSEPPKKDNDKSKNAPPNPVEGDDYEDGDIATPKRDSYGDDDQPL
jgi:hypothetical protein